MTCLPEEEVQSVAFLREMERVGSQPRSAQNPSSR